MSSPVEIIKEMYAAFGRGDVNGVMAHIADDVEWVAERPAEMGFTGACHSKQQIVDRFFGGIAKEHGDPLLEMSEFVAQGDSVATFGRYSATLRNGQRVNSPVAHLFKLRDGKVVHYTNMLNTADFVVSQPVTSGMAISFKPAKMEAVQYDQIIQRLGASGALPPAGGMLHVCYGNPGQLRVLDVFDSLESFQNFAKTLLPIIQQVGVEPGQPEFLPVHSANWK